MRNPVVTIVLPHYGCEQYLRAAAGSILQQTLEQLTLWIVDDASPTDDWLSALGPYMFDPRVRLGRTSRNVGPYRIANALLPSIASPFVAFQDADDVSDPRRLEAELGLLTASRADIVGCSFACVNESGDTSRIWRMPRWANLRHALGMNFLVHHPTMLARRYVFDALNGFDGTTRFGADTDFMTRAAYRFKIRNVREALYSYRQRQGSLTLDPSTGFGSPARARYRSELARRRSAWRRLKHSPLLSDALRARGNDVDFAIHPVASVQAA